MIDFARADQRVPDDGVLPPLCTWDYAPRFLKDDGVHYACQSDKDLALCTCVNGHTCRLVSTVHRVAPDGALNPSYVCPATGCEFHAWVRLVGWDPGHVYEVRKGP